MRVASVLAPFVAKELLAADDATESADDAASEDAGDES